MRWLLILVLVLAVLTLAAAIGIRRLPLEAEEWNTPYDGDARVGDTQPLNGFVALREITTTPEGVLEALDRVAVATPRTIRAAGSVDAGRITWVTRSAVFAFPDYTTAEVVQGPDGPLLVIRGRARLGKGDMGVNRRRIEAWLSRLGPLVVAPA